MNRSPLNVVHAGLELLLVDLKRVDGDVNDRLRAAVELVEDIFSASDTAISILNDLLNYEHMDSGGEYSMKCMSDVLLVIMSHL